MVVLDVSLAEDDVVVHTSITLGLTDDIETNGLCHLFIAWRRRAEVTWWRLMFWRRRAKPVHLVLSVYLGVSSSNSMV